MAPLLPIAGAAVRAVAMAGARTAVAGAARGVGTAVVRSGASTVARSTGRALSDVGSSISSHSGVAGSQQFSHTAPAGGSRNNGITFDTAPHQTGLSSLFGNNEHAEERGVSTLDTDGMRDTKTGVHHPKPPQFHAPMAHMKATSTTVAQNTQSMEKNSIAPIGKGSNQSRWLFGAEESAASPSFTAAAFGRPGG